MEDKAENITADMLPEVPATAYLKHKILRAQVRQINKVDETRGGEISNQQFNLRRKLLAQWDKVPTRNRIDILQDLIGVSFALALVFLPLPAEAKLTAYDKFDKATDSITSDWEVNLISLVHSYQPPKGKKIFYYKTSGTEYTNMYWESTRRIKRSQGHAVIDMRPQDVIHPKLSRWRDRIVFWGPAWSLGTDAAVKGAVGAAAAGGVN